MKRRLVASLFAAVLVFVATPGPAALAHTIEKGDLILIHPTSRPNLPNRPAVAYVTIANDGAAPDRLIRVSSPAFDSAELHKSTMENGVMAMRPVESIDLPPGETVEFAPGGYHIMLFGGSALYKPGDEFPMVFSFEKAGDVTVDVLVEAIDPNRMGAGQTGHGATGHSQPSN